MNLCKSCGISGFGDLTVDVTPSTDIFGNTIDWGNLSGPASGTPSTVNTSTSTFNPSIITGIASAFSNIFKTIQPLPAGCTVVAGPYGQSTSCSGTGTNPLGSSLLGGSLLGGTSTISPVVLIGGAVLLFMMMKK